MTGCGPWPVVRAVIERIVPRYRQLVAELEPTDYYIRGTYTRYNLDFAEDVRHLHDLGFTSLSVEPVVADPEDDYAFKQEDISRICEEYDRLVDLYLESQAEGRPFDFFHFNVDLEQGPCLPKRLTGCGAGFEYLAVTPEGELYPCHQFVGRTEYKLGDVRQGIVHEGSAINLRRPISTISKLVVSAGPGFYAAVAATPMPMPTPVPCWNLTKPAAITEKTVGVRYLLGVPERMGNSESRYFSVHRSIIIYSNAMGEILVSDIALKN